MRRSILVVFGLLVSGLLLGCTGGPPPLAFTPAGELPEAKVGQPYHAAITVTGNRTPVGEMSAQASTLPPGLELHHTRGDDSGVIEGTPKTPGQYSFTVSVWCFGTNVSGQTGGQRYSLVVR